MKAIEWSQCVYDILTHRKGNPCPDTEGLIDFTIQYNVIFIPCAICLSTIYIKLVLYLMFC